MAPPLLRRPMPHPTRIAVGPAARRAARSSAAATGTSASSHQAATSRDVASARNAGRLSQRSAARAETPPRSKSRRPTAIASAKSPPGRGCQNRSHSSAVRWCTGSTSASRAPRARASRSTGIVCGLETKTFLPHKTMFRAFSRSCRSWLSQAPKSASCAASPAPEQMSPRLIVTGPKSSKNQSVIIFNIPSDPPLR